MGAIASWNMLPVLAQPAPTYCPIMMYHHISPPPETTNQHLIDNAVPPEAFAQHLDYVQQAGFTSITMRNLWAGMMGATALPEKPIVFTFDDGYWSAYAHAAPLLLQRGMTGTVYIITGMADQPSYLTWGQIRELHASGIEIGNHSVIHGDMSRQPKNQQRSEIEQSTLSIEAAIGVRPTAFAYPFGRQNAITRNLLKDYGYTTAVTTMDSTLHYASNPYYMGRVRVRNSTTLEALPWLMNRRD